MNLSRVWFCTVISFVSLSWSNTSKHCMLNETNQHEGLSSVTMKVMKHLTIWLQKHISIGTLLFRSLHCLANQAEASAHKINECLIGIQHFRQISKLHKCCWLPSCCAISSWIPLHYCQLIVMAHQSIATRQFVEQLVQTDKTKTPNLRITNILLGESPVASRFSSQGIYKVDSVSRQSFITNTRIELHS